MLMVTAAPAAISVALDLPTGSGASATHALLAAMLRATTRASDLIFSPGRLPQAGVHGNLVPVHAPGLRPLTADDTRRIASDLIGNNRQALSLLREQGSCDVSYGLPGMARFRVNVFIQRGSCAVVMRVIPTEVPDFARLGLPPQLGEIATLRDGIVLVAGPRGSGKSSTLAALVDRINQEHTCHIITIEDPIEFLHNHKRATVHQRELHSDTPSFGQALRAALRQAPQVVMVGDIRDRETMEMLLEAAETGHLVLSSLNTVDAAKTVERIVSSFSFGEQAAVRGRLAKTLRYVLAQRLLPRRDEMGRVAIVEILKVGPDTRECIEYGEYPARTLLKLMKDGGAQGMQDFDGEIEKLVRGGTVALEPALAFATDAQALRQTLREFAP
jgi:twitching motility protein PilT